MKKYIAGIDGGGTKTHILLADTDGNVVNESFGADSNIYSQSAENIKNTLSSLINTVLNETGISGSDVSSLCIGCAGAGRETEKDILRGILSEILPESSITILNDAEIVLLANVESDEGIVLIAGTGSVCYGYKKDIEIRSGGWGHILGDEGSGYYIARKALNAVCKSYDGIIKSTLLTNHILKYFNLTKVTDLIEKIYSFQSKKEIAAMAYLVDKTCEEGDKTAARILEEAAFDLYMMTKAVYDRLKPLDKKCFIVTSGSVINKSRYLFDRYENFIKCNLRGLSIIKGTKSPAYGALNKIKKADAI